MSLPDFSERTFSEFFDEGLPLGEYSAFRQYLLFSEQGCRVSAGAAGAPERQPEPLGCLGDSAWIPDALRPRAGWAAQESADQAAPDRA